MNPSMVLNLPERRDSSCPTWSSQISPWLAPVAYGIGRRALLPNYFREIRVTGQDNIPTHGPVLLAPTHRSRWDSLLVAYVGQQATGRYLRFMVTADECLGLQGWAIKKLGGFPVNGRRPAIATLRHGVELLQRQQMMVIFPEGNIYRSTEVQPLKPGLARIAMQAQQSCPHLNIKVVPLSLQYDRPCPHRGSSVSIRVGEPLSTADYISCESLKIQAKRLTDDLKRGLDITSCPPRLQGAAAA